jgi:hypothetical protein
MTFTRRRLSLLDWYEENTKPLFFTDAPDHTGIAVNAGFERVRLDRETLRLSVESPTAEFAALERPLEGTWATIEPKNVVLTNFYSVWTIPLERDYEDARRALTARTLPVKLGEGERAFDCAALVEIETLHGVYGFEFGVVTAEELVERLKTTQMGLMRSSSQNRPEYVLPLEDAPPVSLFLDVGGMFRKPIRSHSGLIKELGSIEQEISRLVTAIGRTL